MISNKEKRLSQAYDVYTNQLDGPPPQLPMANHHHLVNNLASYGMINNNNNNSNNLSNSNNSGSNGSVSKEHHLLAKKHLNERNSHSLNHDFSHLYISNLKSHMMVNNHSHTQVKKHDRHDVPVLPSLEEINSYKREALEAKKQMMQMEKSITFWCDCTEYWRAKWRKTRDEKKQACDEIKQLKSKLTRLEHQLQMSQDKRNRLGEEVNMVHNELSRYIQRFDSDGGQHRVKQPRSNSAIHYNSDRRVDYRKQRRKKELISNSNNKKNDLSSTEEEEFQRFDLRQTELPLAKVHSVPRSKDFHGPSTTSSNPKVVLRNHERLFDKKIVNRKRFSQVVMCDEDELFQFNQEIPSNSLSKNSDNNTLKYSEANESGNDSSFQQRFMEHVSEEEEEYGEEEEEDSSDQFRRRKQLLAEDSTNGFGSNKAIMNHSNLSTMATNSECANVGSIRADDVDEDSLRSDQPMNQKTPVISAIEVEAEREGIGDEDEDEDDEV